LCVRLDINGWSDSRWNNKPNKHQISLGHTITHGYDIMLRSGL